MEAIIRDLANSRLGQILYILITVWGISTLYFSPVQLIEIENAVLISAGVGVAVAYLPSATAALRKQIPSRSDILALGVWEAWIAIAGERCYSLIGRALHENIEFFNTNLHTFFIFITIHAGFCHLAAPEAIEGRLPARTWAKMGLIVAASVLTIILLAIFKGF